MRASGGAPAAGGVRLRPRYSPTRRGARSLDAYGARQPLALVPSPMSSQGRDPASPPGTAFGCVVATAPAELPSSTAVRTAGPVVPAGAEPALIALRQWVGWAEMELQRAKGVLHTHDSATGRPAPSTGWLSMPSGQPMPPPTHPAATLPAAYPPRRPDSALSGPTPPSAPSRGGMAPQFYPHAVRDTAPRALSPGRLSPPPPSPSPLSPPRPLCATGASPAVSAPYVTPSGADPPPRRVSSGAACAR